MHSAFFSALAAAVVKPEIELSKAVARMDFPIANETEADFQPICVGGDSLNTTAGSIDREDGSLKTLAAAKEAKSTKSTGRRRYKTRIQRRRQANVLTFQYYKSGQKPVKVLLRGKKLLTLFSHKGNVSVVGAKFSHPRFLPTGAFATSKFTLSLVHLKSEAEQAQRHFTTYGGHIVPNHNQWMKVERTILRNASSSICLHQLQQKLTEELDSAAAMDADTESDLSLEHSQSDSLLSNKQTSEQKINRTSIPDEIDDIFGALDD